jgi:hypothetical protein
MQRYVEEVRHTLAVLPLDLLGDRVGQRKSVEARSERGRPGAGGTGAPLVQGGGDPQLGLLYHRPAGGNGGDHSGGHPFLQATSLGFGAEFTFPLASGRRDWPGESWLGDGGIETQVKSELTAAEKAL